MVSPFPPTFSQMVVDCLTDGAPSDVGPLHPPPGCDEWYRNRFERPYDAASPQNYYPDLDILSAELGQAGDWYFLRIMLAGLQDSTDHPEGTFAVEIDQNLDGRGDLLITATSPGKWGRGDWNTQGVQVWEDSNHDVGGLTPSSPDTSSTSDGFDRRIFDSGVGRDPDLAWSRYSFSPVPAIELAFKRSLLASTQHFKWWVWAGFTLDPAQMDYHDSISLHSAGDAYALQVSVPHPLLLRLDNTCKAYWPGLDDADPALCQHDPYIPVAGGTQPGARSPTWAATTATPSLATTSTSPSSSPSMYPTTTIPPPSITLTPPPSPTSTHRPIPPAPSPTPIPPTSPPPTPIPTPTRRNCDPVEGCGETSGSTN